MDRPPMDHPPHARIWTTDYDNLWQVDGGVRLDGLTVHFIDEFGRQTMIICPRFVLDCPSVEACSNEQITWCQTAWY